MAANILSLPTLLNSLTKINYSVSWVGTSPVGTISVQASNDYSLTANGGIIAGTGTWDLLPLDVSGSLLTAIPISGNSGQGMIDISSLAAGAVQLIYMFTSGTGTLTATFCGKVA